MADIVGRDNLPEEVEAPVNGKRTIVTSEGIVFSGTLPILSDPVEELRDALSYINRLHAELIETKRTLADYVHQYNIC